MKECYICGKKANKNLELYTEVMDEKENPRDMIFNFCSKKCVKKAFIKFCLEFDLNFEGIFIDSFEDINFDKESEYIDGEVKKWIKEKKSRKKKYI